MQNYQTNRLLDIKKNVQRINKRWLLSIIFVFINVLTSCSPSEKASMSYHFTGSSMNPGIANGDYLIINPTAYDGNLPERNDIIVFAHPKNPENYLLKRIIGLPGEKIKMQKGQLWINDQLIEEPYIQEPARYSGEWLMGEQEYFVLSDNRNNGSDSHSWGALPFENIEGKAINICKSSSIINCQKLNSE